LPAASREVGGFETAKGIRATNRGAEPMVTEEVVVDPLSANPTRRDNRIILIRVEQINVVALLQVIQREGFPGQKFVQEPEAPGIPAGGFGPGIFKEIFLPCLLKQDAENGEVRPVILEREFEMVAKPFPRPIYGWIDLLDNSFSENYPVDSAGRHQGLVPVRYDIEVIPFDKRRISCRSVYRRILFGFTHDFLRACTVVSEGRRKNVYDAGFFVIF
jgi:hypothetical protein